MKNRLFCLILLFAASFAARAQENFLQTVLIEMPDKTAVSFEPAVVSPNANVLTSNLQNLRQSATSAAQKSTENPAQNSGENRVVRFLSDAANGVVFGYEIQIAPLAAKKFRISLEPLAKNQQPPSALLPKPQSLAGVRRATTILTLPNVVWTQTVAEGDTLTVDLLEHPGLNIKIADKIRVALSRERLVPPTILPRDLTVKDLPIAVTNLKLTVNDQEIELRKNFSGSLLWLHLPAKGFFLIALAPRDGYDFRRLGTIRGNRIEFEFQNDKYKLTSETEILPDDETWTVWVLHDARYQPFFIEPPPNKIAPEKQARQFKNPYELNGSIAQPNERSGYETRTPQNAETNAPAPPVALKPRIGATNDIQHIYPKN